VERKHDTAQPDRDLAAEIDALSLEHLQFAETARAAILELKMLSQVQRTRMDMLEHQIRSVSLSTPVNLA